MILKRQVSNGKWQLATFQKILRLKDYGNNKRIYRSLTKTDPEENLEVVIQYEDGWVYDVSSTAELVHCKEGQVDEDSSPNCVMFNLFQ